MNVLVKSLQILAIFLFIGCDEKKNNLIRNSNFGYREIAIGNQIWMNEDLSTLYFRNGDPIPLVKDEKSWNKAEIQRSPACYVIKKNNDPNEASRFFYNYYAITDDRGLIPSGWRLPSVNEFEQLIEFLGGTEDSYINGQFEYKVFTGEKTCNNCTTWNQSKKITDSCTVCDDTSIDPKWFVGGGTKFIGFPNMKYGIIENGKLVENLSAYWTSSKDFFWPWIKRHIFNGPVAVYYSENGYEFMRYYNHNTVTNSTVEKPIIFLEGGMFTSRASGYSIRCIRN